MVPFKLVLQNGRPTVGVRVLNYPVDVDPSRGNVDLRDGWSYRSIRDIVCQDAHRLLDISIAHTIDGLDSVARESVCLERRADYVSVGV